jgi:hypothetical protein
MLRQWKRGHDRHRSFTVLRHPLARAHAVFNEVQTRPKPELKQVLHRAYGVDLPRDGYGDEAALRAGFLGFLRFLKAALSGQASLRVEAAWASQSAVLQGFAQMQAPDLVIREDRLAEGLAFLAAEAGVTPPALATAEPAADFPLERIYGADLEEAAREAYARDYLGFGFGDWRKAAG